VTYTSVTTGRNNLLLAAASDSYEQSYSALQPKANFSTRAITVD